MVEDLDHVDDGRKDRWISANKALQLVARDGLTDKAAADELAFHLRQGKLRAKARQIWQADERSTKAAWKNGPAYDKSASLQPVPVRNWRYEVNPSGDRDRWRWVSSRFAVTINSKPKRRIMMRGVRFSRDDLEALYPAITESSTKRKRGPTPDIEKRDMLWSAVIDLFFDGTLKPGTAAKASWIAELLTNKLSFGPNSTLRVGKNQIDAVASKVAGAIERLSGTRPPPG